MSSLLFTKIGRSGNDTRMCDDFNNAIKNSKFAEFYGVLNSAVVTQMGPTFQFNWRWFDPNLLLSQLKLFKFGKIDWYNDITVEHGACSGDTCRDIRSVLIAFNKLSTAQKIDVLTKSVIERMDALMAASLNDAAMLSEQRGQHEKAIERYKKSLALDPHCLSSMYNYADLLAKSDKGQRAMKLLNTLLVLMPENAQAWGIHAMILEQEGKLNTAAESYERAYQIDKTSATRLRNYAMLMIDMNSYERAKILYEETIALDPTKGVVIGEYADLLHTMGLKSEAVTQFERAIATGNTNLTVINDYAVLLQKIEMLQKSKDMIASINMPNPLTEVSRDGLANKIIMPIVTNVNCASCAGEGKFSCGKCRNARYCCRECQVRDWKSHKILCKKE